MLDVKINKSASHTITVLSKDFGTVHVLQYSDALQPAVSMLKLQYVVLCASSLLVRTAGCIYREISGLPLAEWAPLVLGLSFVTAGRRTAFQTALSFSPSNWVTHKLARADGKRKERHVGKMEKVMT